MHLAFQSQKWFKMNEEQRCRKIEKFMKAPVSCETVHRNSERTSQSSVVNALAVLELPLYMKDTVWHRVQSLANESALVKSSDDQLAWIVKSLSNQQLHFVHPSNLEGAFAMTTVLPAN